MSKPLRKLTETKLKSTYRFWHCATILVVCFHFTHQQKTIRLSNLLASAIEIAIDQVRAHLAFKGNGS